MPGRGHCSDISPPRDEPRPPRTGRDAPAGPTDRRCAPRALNADRSAPYIERRSHPASLTSSLPAPAPEALYHSMVCRRPSSNEVVAAKPNRSRARLVSSARRGWPSGFVGSQRISPVKPVSLGDQLHEVADRDLLAGAQVDRLGAVVALGGEDDALGGVVDVEELARGRAGAPDVDVVGARSRRASTHFLMSAGITCELRRVEVVAGAVEVDRDAGRSTLKPYCCAVGLALDQEHLLGQAVGGVRLLRVAVPEVVLAERHRRELGVGADRADRDELLDAGQARLLHELDAHDRVVVEEAARVLAVGADAADDGGEVDDDVGPAVGEGAVDPVARAQVVVARCGARRRRSAPAASRRRDDGPAEEAGAAGDHDAAARPEVAHRAGVPRRGARPGPGRPRARSASSMSRTSSSERRPRPPAEDALAPWRRRRRARPPRSGGSSAASIAT